MGDCVKKLQHYCYCCGKFSLPQSLVGIGDNIERIYELYFNKRVMHNVPWAPNKICRTCYNSLLLWFKDKAKSMQFGVPTIWSDAGAHDQSNCYVCKNDYHGVNRKKRHSMYYVGTAFVELPLPHSDAVPVPRPPNPGTFSAIMNAPSTSANSASYDDEVSTRMQPVTQDRMDYI